jgi:hypothetical protein
VSSSSNLTIRPHFKALTRANDDQLVIVNLDMVRVIVPTANGVRLQFGNTGNDHLDVKLVTVRQLATLLDP